MLKNVLFSTTITLLLICSLITTTYANPTFTKIYFLGDGLTDMGNYQQGAFPSDGLQPAPITNRLQYSSQIPPYKTWAEFLAEHFGLNATASSIGGDNYATASETSFQAFVNQERNIPPPSDPANTLYVIWIGANDIKTQMPPTHSMCNVIAIISELYEKGARNFLILSLYDMSKTPIFANCKHHGGSSCDQAGAMHEYCNLWNEEYLLHAVNVMVTLAYSPGLIIYYYKVNPLLENVITNPASYGFKATFPSITNQTEVCGTTTCSNNQLEWVFGRYHYKYYNKQQPFSNPDDFIFYNAWFFTTHFNKILADSIYNDCFTGTPHGNCTLYAGNRKPSKRKYSLTLPLLNWIKKTNS